MKRQYDMWEELMRMQEQMDEMLGNFFSPRPYLPLPHAGGESGLRNYRAPVSDVWETGKEIRAELELPGFDKKDIRVSLENNVLTVKAERKEEKEEKKKGRYRLERSSAGFYRCLTLPENIDADKAKVKYENGLLDISVPKKELPEKQVKELPVG